MQWKANTYILTVYSTPFSASLARVCWASPRPSFLRQVSWCPNRLQPYCHKFKSIIPFHLPDVRAPNPKYRPLCLFCFGETVSVALHQSLGTLCWEGHLENRESAGNDGEVSTRSIATAIPEEMKDFKTLLQSENVTVGWPDRNVHKYS